MAQQTELKVAPRKLVGKATKQLRRQGLIPANIYGHKEDSVPIQVDAHEFEVLHRQHELRNILSLKLPDTGAQTVLVRHVQHSPVSGQILHIDFSRVSMGERIEAKLPLNFVGEAPGVKIEGGVLLHLVEALAVSCRASDIVEAIDVDISSLKNINDVLLARDIKLPNGYELSISPDEPVAKVDPPRVEVPTAAETAPAAPTASAESSES